MTDPKPASNLSRDELLARLNAETGKIEWSWLKPHAKSGAVIVLDERCDLVDVAASIAEDDGKRIRELMQGNQLRKPGAEELEYWEQNNSQFWSVVVAPFVLIQPITPSH